MKPRLSFLLLVILVPSSLHGAAFAGADDEKIIGVWERQTGKDKDLLEETWVIKKTKDKWSVSGTILNNLGKEVGNFRGKDVKYVDETLTFTQDYFMLPKGRENGVKISASAEGDRIDFTITQGKSEAKDNMRRAGDASEVLGTWKADTAGMKEVWTFAKDSKGALSIRGTFTKDGKEVGSWKGISVRYFMRTLKFNQEFDKLPPAWENGALISGSARDGEFVFTWSVGRNKGKGKVTSEIK
jgi:hypothetical protein